MIKRLYLRHFLIAACALDWRLSAYFTNTRVIMPFKWAVLSCSPITGKDAEIFKNVKVSYMNLSLESKGQSIGLMRQSIAPFWTVVYALLVLG